MASIHKRNGSYMFMVSCGASSFAVLAEGDRWVDCDRLFTKPDGMPIHPDTASSFAVLGRHIRLVCLVLAPQLLLSPPRGARRGPLSADAAAAEQLDLIFTNRTANIS